MYEAVDEYSGLDALIQSIKESINCSLPCQVKAVRGNFVDVLVFRNDEIEDSIIPNVPIKRAETSSAYIFLGIKVGDYGTIRFYDKSIESYKLGDTNYNGDDRSHNINDGAFELGFIPSSSAFVYPTADIEIGLKNGNAKINITDGNIIITGGNVSITGQSKTSIIGGDVNIDGSNIIIGSNTTIDGKVFLEHTHSNGNNGSPTGAVL